MTVHAGEGLILSETPKRRRRNWGWRFARLTILAGLAAAASAAVTGFLLFANEVADLRPPAAHQRADAIIALTGGAARINDAVELLSQGRARRLLITGVHPDTTTATLARFSPGQDELFDCCVDLGYEALNTVGNAKEARDWARRQGFRSLIIVTSSYHLPRSLYELRREMPEARLIPYPVVTDPAAMDRWWRRADVSRLLLGEYAKFLMSIARLRWRPATTWDAGLAATGLP